MLLALTTLLEVIEGPAAATRAKPANQLVEAQG